MEQPYLISFLFTSIAGLVCYMWVRLQRQIDKQQSVIQGHDNILVKVQEQKNGEMNLMNQKLETQTHEITEIKTELKELSKLLHEMKGNNHINEKSATEMFTVLLEKIQGDRAKS